MLVNLNLRDTEISNEGAKFVGKLIEENQEIKCLDLSWNKI